MQYERLETAYISTIRLEDKKCDYTLFVYTSLHFFVTQLDITPITVIQLRKFVSSNFTSFESSKYSAHHQRFYTTEIILHNSEFWELQHINFCRRLLLPQELEWKMSKGCNVKILKITMIEIVTMTNICPRFFSTRPTWSVLQSV